MKEYHVEANSEKMTSTIQAAIDACAEDGGGRVVLTGGTYECGTLFLRSHVHLQIEASAVLKMSDDIRDFPDFPCEWDVTKAPRYSARCFLYIGNSENVSIGGLGVIDCNGEAYCKINPHASQSDSDPFLCHRMKRKLPYEASIGRMIFVMKSKNVSLYDFTLRDMAGGWGIWINGSEFVNARNLKLTCCPDYPNSDGIHINCSRDVFVTDCAIHTGDDALVVRANTDTLGKDIPSENIIVKGCTLSSHCQAIRVGWIGDGETKNCIFSDLVITDSRDAITIELPGFKEKGADCGGNTTRIHGLAFDNIMIDRTCRHPVKMVIGESPLVQCDGIRDIQFRHLHAKTGCFPLLTGRADNWLEDISFIDCQFDIDGMNKTNSYPRYVRNLRMDCVFNIRGCGE